LSVVVDVAVFQQIHPWLDLQPDGEVPLPAQALPRAGVRDDYCP
jgi:hypothetical protein